MIPALVGKRACLFVPLAVLLLAAPFATAQVGVPTEQAPTSAATQRIAVTAGQSTVLSTDFDVTRIAVTNPRVLHPKPQRQTLPPLQYRGSFAVAPPQPLFLSELLR